MIEWEATCSDCGGEVEFSPKEPAYRVING